MADIISIVVYFFLFFVAPMTIYLKKSGKTFVELVKEVIEFFRGINE